MEGGEGRERGVGVVKEGDTIFTDAGRCEGRNGRGGHDDGCHLYGCVGVRNWLKI